MQKKQTKKSIFRCGSGTWMTLTQKPLPFVETGERERERASKQLRVRRPSNDASNISDTCRCLATFGTFFYLQAAAHGSANGCRTCVTLANCNLTAKIWICVGFCVSSGQRTSVCSHVNCHCYCSVLIILSCTYCSSQYIYIYISYTWSQNETLTRTIGCFCRFDALSRKSHICDPSTVKYINLVFIPRSP